MCALSRAMGSSHQYVPWLSATCAILSESDCVEKRAVPSLSVLGSTRRNAPTSAILLQSVLAVRDAVASKPAPTAPLDPSPYQNHNPA